MNAAGAVAPWRFAARLARREVMRRPWRTVLVALLVAVPVGGMTVASVLARADNRLTWLEQEYGEGTDLAITRPVAQTLDVEQLLPAGSSIRQVRSAWVGLELADGRIIDSAWLSDSGDFSDGAFNTADGHQPSDGEVWLTSRLADQMRVEVGDALVLNHPEGSWTVAGIGRSAVAFNRRAMVMPDLPLSQFRDGVFRITIVVDLPETLTPEQISAIANNVQDSLLRGADMTDVGMESGTTAYVSWDDGRERDQVAPLAWTWVVGTIALAATGIIVSAAFATSARRQLVTIGVLSASGSPERLVRRTLAAQGAWTGVVGSVIGVTLGLATLVAGRGTFERLNGYRLGTFRPSPIYLALIALTGIGAATVSALVPARTASRVPVMAALAGRRPLGNVPGRLVPRGIGFAAFGSLLLVVGALSRDGGAAPTVAAMVGGVFVLIGMCCCSPLAVDLLGRACARLSGTWRLAGRGLSRTRTRSAAIVTAIAVIGALTMSGAASILASNADGEGWRELPADAVMLVPSREASGTDDLDDLEAEPNGPVPADLRAAVDAVVPGARWSALRVATWDPPPLDIERDELAPTAWWRFVVADEALLDLYELPDADRRALERTGVLVNSQWVLDSSAPMTELDRITLPVESGDVDLPVAIRERVRRGVADNEFTSRGVVGFGDFLITEQAAAAAGFDIVEIGGFLRSDAPLTGVQRNRLQSAVYGSAFDLGSYYLDVPQPETAESSRWSPYFDWPEDPAPETAIQGLLVGIAFVLTLLVVAIGLALAAAEGVAERDVLVAIGGRPSTMRSMAAVQAVVLAVTGLGLAVPFGLLPTYAVLRATDHGFHVPWMVLGLLVGAVPALAGAITWLVSAVGQAIRPVRISTLAFD